MKKDAVLILETGQIFPARRFGADGEIAAELVFTTAMVGYVETLTDPGYHGQIVVQTFPLIGNYGVMREDFESQRPQPCAYVVREYCRRPSNFRCEGDLDGYLKAGGVIGLHGVDTRALTRAIRKAGAVSAAILNAAPEDIRALTRALSEKAPLAGVGRVTCAAPRSMGEGARHAVLWDFGHRRSAARAMVSRGCRVTVAPAFFTAREILALEPDGVLLSGGPGEAAANHSIIREVRALAETGVPLFGIDLGHQLLALAMGAQVRKLKQGHRGLNQPVRCLKTGRLFITDQNHGYVVGPQSLPGARQFFENANDHTCEGLEYDHINAFGVQFHPEAQGGPLSTSFLFDQFISRMEGCAHAARI